MKKEKRRPLEPREPHQTTLSRSQVISPGSCSLPRTGSHGDRVEWRPCGRRSPSVAVVTLRLDSCPGNNPYMGTHSVEDQSMAELVNDRT